MAVVVRAGTSRESARRTALRTGETVIDTEGDILFTGDGQAWSPGLGIPEDVFQNSDGDFIPADSPRARSERGTSSTGAPADVQGGEPLAPAQQAPRLTVESVIDNITEDNADLSEEAIRELLIDGGTTASQAAIIARQTVREALQGRGDEAPAQAAEPVTPGAAQAPTDIPFENLPRTDNVPGAIQPEFGGNLFEIDPQLELQRTRGGRQAIFQNFLENMLGPNANLNVRSAGLRQFSPIDVAFTLQDLLSGPEEFPFRQFVGGLGNVPSASNIGNLLNQVIGSQQGQAGFRDVLSGTGGSDIALDIAQSLAPVGRFSPLRSALESGISRRFSSFLGGGGDPLEFLRMVQGNFANRRPF